jgi:hypothetical protein
VRSHHQGCAAQKGLSGAGIPPRHGASFAKHHLSTLQQGRSAGRVSARRVFCESICPLIPMPACCSRFIPELARGRRGQFFGSRAQCRVPTRFLLACVGPGAQPAITFTPGRRDQPNDPAAVSSSSSSRQYFATDAGLHLVTSDTFAARRGGAKRVLVRR